MSGNPKGTRRQVIDGWAKQVVAKLIDRLQDIATRKLSEKMYEAYRRGRRDERLQIASYLDAYGLGEPVRNLAHRTGESYGEPEERACSCTHCEHGTCTYRQCSACINACLGQMGRP